LRLHFIWQPNRNTNHTIGGQLDSHECSHKKTCTKRNVNILKLTGFKVSGAVEVMSECMCASFRVDACEQNLRFTVRVLVPELCFSDTHPHSRRGRDSSRSDIDHIVHEFCSRPLLMREELHLVLALFSLDVLHVG